MTMAIYKCKACDKKKPCVLIVSGESTGAAYCPIAKSGKPIWKQMGVWTFETD